MEQKALDNTDKTVSVTNSTYLKTVATCSKRLAKERHTGKTK